MRLNKDFISTKDLTKEDILYILDIAKRIEAMKKEEKINLLNGRVLATLFFEPSTRTRLSFESAMKQLGGAVIGFADKTVTSVAKGESLMDTIRVVERYSDIIVMRHPLDGAARLAADIAKIPIINAGDGSNQHPTQTLLDIYTIQKIKGRLENLSIGFLGDLKYGRTVHSLALALSLFNVNLYFISPNLLKMPSYLINEIKKNNQNIKETENIDEISKELDVVYATRIQKERFSDIMEYEKLKESYKLKKADLVNFKSDVKIMHPLPRVDELSYDLDDTENAVYFDQLANGIPIRQALICLLLGVLQ
ncbi:aspartate carbamoyltransferase [Candidatus Woesearchaeota archaeon]|nr:aspartate carbamoyltransferase [Candidatus Woesearchaeota archaeon]